MRPYSAIPTILCLALVALVGMQLTAQTPARTAPDGAAKVPATLRPAGNHPVRAVGTITYDNNVPFQRDPQVNGMVGNRFTPGTDPHTVTSVSFRVAGNYLDSVVASVWQPAGASLNILRRWIVTGVPSGAGATASTVVVPVATGGATPTTSPITGHSGSFLAGIRNTLYTGLSCSPPSTGLNSTCDGVALTEGTATIGNGLHGVRVQFSDPVFVPTVATMNSSGVDFSQNAIMRATGESLPVELMSFSVN